MVYFPCFIFLILITGTITSVPPIVHLPLGQLEGTVKTSFKNTQFYAFEGVPYASPPIGKHKFKEAIPPKPWDGVLKAQTIYTCIQCDQYSYHNPDSDCIKGDEDCLYLNIYTPTLNQSAALDVLVYIHGGAFMFNNGGAQRPDLIMSKPLVYINLNYRLGPLGFLSTEDAVLPGNAGLKDQILALKWIQSNIHFFGGNARSVTIMGMSAGGASVHLHLLSPLSSGLFHRAISQSGCALNPWVLVERPLDKTKKLARLVGCPETETREMVACLRRRPARQIVGAVKAFLGWKYNPFSPFGVVVDTWAAEPLLPDHPYNLMAAGRVANDLPWILSHTNAEGLYPGGVFYNDRDLGALDGEWGRIAPFIFDYNNTVRSEDMAAVSSGIRTRYFGEERVSKATFARLIQALSDRLFIVDIRKVARLYRGGGWRSPAYFYVFGYRGAHSKSELFTGTNLDFGASHCDDTSYVFKTVTDTTSNADDRWMVDRMLEMVTTFARTGVPEVGVSWPAVNSKKEGSVPYLGIDGPERLSVKYVEEDELQFWDGLPISENEKLVLGIKDEL